MKLFYQYMFYFYYAFFKRLKNESIAETSANGLLSILLTLNIFQVTIAFYNLKAHLALSETKVYFVLTLILISIINYLLFERNIKLETKFNKEKPKTYWRYVVLAHLALTLLLIFLIPFYEKQ